MTVTEHGWPRIIGCDNCRHTTKRQEAGGNCPSCGGGKLIEYVPLAACRGAVEALERIAALDVDKGGPGFRVSPEYLMGAGDAAEIARAALGGRDR